MTSSDNKLKPFFYQRPKNKKCARKEVKIERPPSQEFLPKILIICEFLILLKAVNYPATTGV